MTEEKMNKSDDSHLTDFLLSEGDWNDDVHWKFVISNKDLDLKLCTAVFCVINYDKRIVLTKNKARGWELPGGHIEGDETILEAVYRETREETGIKIIDPKMFGYRELETKKPISYRDRQGYTYPFPYSYIPYYYSVALGFNQDKLAEDVEEVKLASFMETIKLLSTGNQNEKIIKYLSKTKLIQIE